MIPELPLHAEGEVWICNPCRMIGTKEEAVRHREATGHHIELVPDDVAEAVRAERMRLHNEFVAMLMGAGKFNSAN